MGSGYVLNFGDRTLCGTLDKAQSRTVQKRYYIRGICLRALSLEKSSLRQLFGYFYGFFTSTFPEFR